MFAKIYDPKKRKFRCNAFILLSTTYTIAAIFKTTLRCFEYNTSTPPKQYNKKSPRRIDGRTSPIVKNPKNHNIYLLSNDYGFFNVLKFVRKNLWPKKRENFNAPLLYSSYPPLLHILNVVKSQKPQYIPVVKWLWVF